MSEDDEEWRDIPCWEGLYQASNLGDIRSLPRTVKSSHGSIQYRPGRVLKQSPQGNGYLIVSLANSGTKTTRLVHRLVCQAFHGAIHGMDAAHKDGQKTNNAADNLYWASRSRNIQDQVTHGTHQYGSRTHCKNGHEYTDSTTLWHPSYSGRYCGVCQKERNTGGVSSP